MTAIRFWWRLESQVLHHQTVHQAALYHPATAQAPIQAAVTAQAAARCPARIRVAVIQVPAIQAVRSHLLIAAAAHRIPRRQVPIAQALIRVLRIAAVAPQYRVHIQAPAIAQVPIAARLTVPAAAQYRRLIAVRVTVHHRTQVARIQVLQVQYLPVTVLRAKVHPAIRAAVIQVQAVRCPVVRIRVPVTRHRAIRVRQVPYHRAIQVVVLRKRRCQVLIHLLRIAVVPIVRRAIVRAVTVPAVVQFPVPILRRAIAALQVRFRPVIAVRHTAVRPVPYRRVIVRAVIRVPAIPAVVTAAPVARYHQAILLRAIHLQVVL